MATAAPSPANYHSAPDYRPVLDELIEHGMDIIRDLHRELGAGLISAFDAVPAFESASRAVRRTIMLAQRCNEAGPSSAQSRAAARRNIIRSVEDAIKLNAKNPADGDRLQRELDERMDGPDILEDVGNRPTPDIIADICRDLGVASPGPQPWKRRTPADIANLIARAAEPAIKAHSETAHPMPEEGTCQNPLPPAGEGRVRVVHQNDPNSHEHAQSRPKLE